VEQWDKEGVLLRFSASDTGLGIPAEKREMIFEAFTQADGSTKRKHGGTGLGLAISAQLVGRMGGKIWLVDNPGGGTTFHFTVSFGAGQPTAESAIPRQASEFQGARILLADDNATVRQILGETLTDWGMTVIPVDSNAAALVRMHRAWEAGRPFAAALIDGDMSPSSGLALLDLMQAQYIPPRGVIMTLPPSAVTAEAAVYRERGITACLRKPVRQSELREALRTALQLGRSASLRGQDRAEERDAA
jgi:CheY-like chemotaxis protein